MNEQENDKLMAAAAKLATGVAPERDLWPGIEAAITAPVRETRPTRYWAQAAAVVLLVAASSGITFLLTSDGNQPAQIAGLQPDGGFDSEFASFGASHTLGQGFQDAHNNLAAQLDLELDRLSPEARTEVEENLAVIRGAIAEINEALINEPDNVLLQDMLLKSYREELAVMRDVGGLTQKVMSRNDI
jgi:hypothetical protein